jgi:hypothetical protein
VILAENIDRMSNRRFGSWFVTFGQLAAALVWVLAVNSLTSSDKDDDIESRAAGSIEASGSANTENAVDGFGVYRSDYYGVIFRESQCARVDRVFWSVDQLHEDVRKFFGNPMAPRTGIVLDTASPVVNHVSGQTNWTRIRVPPIPAVNDEEFLRTESTKRRMSASNR